MNIYKFASVTSNLSITDIIKVFKLQNLVIGSLFSKRIYSIPSPKTKWSSNNYYGKNVSVVSSLTL